MSTILITGAGRGIGRSLAKELIDRGHDVIGTARDGDSATALHEELGSRLSVLQFDVTDARAILEAARTFEGAIDVLVNNAGVIGPDRQSTLDMDFDGFAETLQINTLAPLMISQAFLPHLKRGKSPRIITISSQLGMMNEGSDRIAYRASKAAVNKVMRGLATDLKAVGIAVQLIHPGWVQSDMGGPHAAVTLEQSARGIADRIEALNMNATNTFVDYDGSPRNW